MQTTSKTWYSWLLNPWVILLSLLLGIVFGKYFPYLSIETVWIGNIYLSLLQMCIIPLIVTAITTSFAKLMHSKIENQLIRRMVIIFVSSLILAAIIGLIFSVLGNIGANLTENSQNSIGTLLLQSEDSARAVSSHSGAILNEFFSNNIFQALAKGQNIPILMFAILLGLALGFITNKAGQETLVIFDGLFQTFLTLVNGMMYLLPIGLLSLIANEIAHTGFQMLTVAGQLILYTYLLGIVLIAIFIFITSRRTKVSFWKTCMYLRETIVIAFVSSSSFAALPFGISALSRNFKLSQTKVNLFFPLSVCLNPVGTTYFLVLVAVFISHLYGQPVGAANLVLIGVLAIVSSLAIGSVPAVAGFSLLGMLFTPLGLPSSTAIVLLIAISDILDPIVTVVNITSNITATALLSTPEETLKEELHELVS